MKTLDKYVAREMMVPFVAGFAVILVLLVFTVIYQMVGWAKDHLDQKPLLLYYFVLTTLGGTAGLPSFIVISLPSGALFGCSLAVARLTHDSEITMMRIAGVSVKRIFLPLLVVGVLLTIAAYAFQENIGVWANRESVRVYNRIMSAQGPLPIQSNAYFKVNNYCFYVNSITKQGRGMQLNNVMIYESPVGSGFATLITAKSAVEENRIWVLRDGSTWRVSRDGDPELYARFPKMRLDIPQPMDYYLNQDPKSPKTMSLAELRQQIKLLKTTGMDSRECRLEYAFKSTIPLSSLVLALCIAPLSLKLGRSGGFMGVLAAIIVLFFYYNVFVFSRLFAEAGWLSPTLAGWSNVIIFGSLAAVLLWRVE